MRTLACFCIAFTAFSNFAAARSFHTDDDVQKLLNFPALARLGAQKDPDDLDRYLARISSAYQRAGYMKLAKALAGSQALIQQFASPEGEGEIKRARMALRHIKDALSWNRRIVLPAKVGDRIPNYHAIVLAFTKNADRILDAQRDGKSADRFLERKDDRQWIINDTGFHFSLTGENPGEIFENAGTTASGFVFTTLESGSISGGYSFGSSSDSIRITVTGDAPESAHVPSVPARIAFLPGVTIPWPYSTEDSYVLESDQTINGVEVPAGSRIFTFNSLVDNWDEALLIPGVE